jgi:hypothetical protein
MDEQLTDQQLQQQLGERLKQLPKVVQDAIASADVQRHLRELASTHKLHIDQWELLENNVMLTLLGFQEPEALPTELQKDLNVDTAVASALAEDISRVVFAPIREELEREIQPEVAADEDEPIAVAQHRAASAPKPSVAPATPPAPPSRASVMRAPISESYTSGQGSTERKSIEGDPYRETLE